MGKYGGSGTDVCARCGKAKEPTRYNSQHCRACDRERGGVAVTVRLKPEVWARLDAEARSKNLPVARYVQNLIEARDKRVSGNGEGSR